MTDRIDPAETKKVWEGVETLWENGLLSPTIYDCEYRGLEGVVPAMKDLACRKVWGKAIVTLDGLRPRL